MKKITILLHLVLFSLILSAQAYEGKAEYLKKDQQAMVIDFPYAPSIVEDAIVERMEKLGYKKKESKGFLIYKSAVLSEISLEPADYMIKVERKSRKEKDESVVYLLINRGEEDVISRSDALVNSNAKTFLNNLSPHVEAFNLEREIETQETAVGKAEKKLRDLKDDQASMEKKIKSLEEDLKDNAKNQENQLKQIEAQRQMLEGMRAKRR